MNEIPPDETYVPQAITTYQAAHDRRDIDTALAQFAPHSRVVDDGNTYEGIAGVESFLRTAASEYTYTRTLLAATEISPGHWRIVHHLEGDFPGGQVDLAYEFHLAGGLITQLTIAP
jgi:hypothetical protein